MRTKLFFCIAICCVTQPILALAQQPYGEEFYRQKFIAFMTPRITEAALQQVMASGIKRDGAEKMITRWVSGIADCQISGMNKYPPNYKAAAYAAVAAGGSIPDATSTMNQRLIMDMGKDEATKQQLTELINSVKQDGLVCIDSARLRAGIK